MANTRFIIDLNDFTHEAELDDFYGKGDKSYYSKDNDEIRLLLIPNRDIANGTDVYWDCDDNTYTQYLFTHIGLIVNGVLSGNLFNYGTSKHVMWDL